MQSIYRNKRPQQYCICTSDLKKDEWISALSLRLKWHSIQWCKVDKFGLVKLSRIGMQQQQRQCERGCSVGKIKKGGRGSGLRCKVPQLFFRAAENR